MSREAGALSAPTSAEAGRDWEVLRAALGVDDLTVLGGPSSGGWSADTVILDADGRRLVARFNPRSEGLFPAADLSVQVACLRAAHEAGLPVPDVVFDDSFGRLMGEAMFVMEFVEGYAPRDLPPHFAHEGVLVDATPAQQRTYYCDMVDLVARLSTVEPPAGVLTTGPDLLDHVRHLHELRLARGSDLEIFDEVEAQLRETVPPLAPTGMLWGDPRPANTIMSADFRVASMLDWELAALGPAEMDVAWLWEMNVLRGDPARPDGRILPGFLDRVETWDHWSAKVGRTPVGVVWHHLFAAYKVALILDLNFRVQVRRGELDPNHRIFGNNRALRRLTTLAASRTCQA